jgi:hypothetical protein
VPPGWALKISARSISKISPAVSEAQLAVGSGPPITLVALIAKQLTVAAAAGRAMVAVRPVIAARQTIPNSERFTVGRCLEVTFTIQANFTEESYQLCSSSAAFRGIYVVFIRSFANQRPA